MTKSRTQKSRPAMLSEGGFLSVSSFEDVVERAGVLADVIGLPILHRPLTMTIGNGLIA